MALPTEEQKARVTRFVAKWKPLLYLQQYEIVTIFHDRGPDNGDGDDDAGRMFVKCAYADRYHHLAINIYPGYFEEDTATQERMVVHELVHVPLEIISCLIDRQRDGGMVTPKEQEYAVERATDWLANALFFEGAKDALKSIPTKKAERLSKRGK